MAGDVNVLNLILKEVQELKTDQKEMRQEITNKFGTIHKRVDDLVKDRSQCEIASIKRDNELEKQIWKTSGIVAGIITFVFELAKFILSKIIK